MWVAVSYNQKNILKENLGGEKNNISCLFNGLGGEREILGKVGQM